jgi:hypothetical protein
MLFILKFLDTQTPARFTYLEDHHAGIRGKVRGIPDLFAEGCHERIDGRIVGGNEGEGLIVVQDFGPKGSHVHLGKFRVVEAAHEGMVLNDLGKAELFFKFKQQFK